MGKLWTLFRMTLAAYKRNCDIKKISRNRANSAGKKLNVTCTCGCQKFLKSQSTLTKFFLPIVLLFLQVFFVQRKNLEDDWLIVILKNETNDSFQIQSYVQLLLFKMRSAAKKLGNENKSEIQGNYEFI